jgi:predicted HTH domain antitoxin
MIISVELPDSFARQLRLDGEHGQRRVLEIFALDGYRSGELSQGQVGELLGMSFHETEQFLQTHHAPPGLGPDEHLRGLKNLERAMGR